MSEQAHTPPPKDDAMPLPGWLMKVYYIFPVILYVPDMLFNFYVYSDGSGLDTSKFTLENLPGYLLWGFLAAGIVGMAWLCSVLAPWHWIKGNHFQSIMCWFGVIIATAITIWNSLAYRSLDFKTFQTDKWLQDASHISGFSLTMILVSVAPPFWGLFWAIVQPAVGKKSLAEEQESHAMKIERMKQEAEYKRLRAEANATVRAAQLKGLASTARAARAQITGHAEASVQEEPPRIVDTDKVPALPLRTNDQMAWETPDSPYMDSPTGVFPTINKGTQRTPSGPKPKPLPGSKDYPSFIEEQRRILVSQDKPADAQSIASATGEKVEDIQMALRTWRAQQAAARPAGRPKR